MDDAFDYKVYWDKGTHSEANKAMLLSSTTNLKPEFQVDKRNSNGILSSSHGGTYKFWVTYISKSKEGQESLLSNPCVVIVEKNEVK